MRRAEREITDAAALAGILGRAGYAVLAFLDGGTPALVPVSFGFRQEEDGRFVFYFHSAVEGHKIDCLREDSRVSLCAVGDNRIELGTPVCRSTCRYESVIATGRIEFVTAPEAKRRALDCLMNHCGAPVPRSCGSLRKPSPARAISPLRRGHDRNGKSRPPPGRLIAGSLKTVFTDSSPAQK